MPGVRIVGWAIEFRIRKTSEMMRWLPVASLVAIVHAWRICDVTKTHGAIGDGVTKDTASIRLALLECDEVILPAGKVFSTAPLNVSSNQVLRVDGTLLAPASPGEFPLVEPLLGYGWSNDENCFPPDMDKHMGKRWLLIECDDSDRH